jgi:hypothetical protein
MVWSDAGLLSWDLRNKVKRHSSGAGRSDLMQGCFITGLLHGVPLCEPLARPSTRQHCRGINLWRTAECVTHTHRTAQPNLARPTGPRLQGERGLQGVHGGPRPGCWEGFVRECVCACVCVCARLCVYEVGKGRDKGQHSRQSIQVSLYHDTGEQTTAITKRSRWLCPYCLSITSLHRDVQASTTTVIHFPPDRWRGGTFKMKWTSFVLYSWVYLWIVQWLFLHSYIPTYFFHH